MVAPGAREGTWHAALCTGSEALWHRLTAVADVGLAWAYCAFCQAPEALWCSGRLLLALLTGMLLVIPLLRASCPVAACMCAVRHAAGLCQQWAGRFSCTGLWQLGRAPRLEAKKGVLGNNCNGVAAAAVPELGKERSAARVRAQLAMRLHGWRG